MRFYALMQEHQDDLARIIVRTSDNRISSAQLSWLLRRWRMASHCQKLRQVLVNVQRLVFAGTKLYIGRECLCSIIY